MTSLDPVGVSAAAKALAVAQRQAYSDAVVAAGGDPLPVDPESALEVYGNASAHAEIAVAAYLAVAGSPADERASTPNEEFTEAAWGLIANAYGGNWSDAPDEWHGAACRWRDEYVAGATARIPAASPADERLREALALIGELTDPDPCQYDHNDLCQAHGLDPDPCPHWRAKVLLAGVSAEAPKGERITHGRHCTCSACAAEDWTNPQLAPCGMHGSSCPAEYAPLGGAGDWVSAEATPDDFYPGPRGAEKVTTPGSWTCCGQTFSGTADFISGVRSAHVCPPEDVPDAETAYGLGKTAWLREVNDLRDQVQMYEEKAERDWRDFGEMQDARIAADDRVVELEKELARVCKQLDSANDMVERAWSLTAGAMSGNPHRPTANTEWMDAAHAWEHDYCMGQGTLGGES